MDQTPRDPSVKSRSISFDAGAGHQSHRAEYTHTQSSGRSLVTTSQSLPRAHSGSNQQPAPEPFPPAQDHSRTFRVYQLAERDIEEETEEVRSKDGRTAQEMDRLPTDCHQRQEEETSLNTENLTPAAGDELSPIRRLKMSVFQPAVEERDLMEDHSSYHQSIPGDEAIRRLKLSGANRCYLTRYSEKQKSYALTVYMKQTPQDVERHFKVVLGEDRKHTVEGSNKSFNEIEELLHHYKTHRIDHSLKNIGVEYPEERYFKKIQRKKCTLS